MRTPIVLLSAFLVATSAEASQTVRTISWADLGAAGQLVNGRVLPGAVLELEPKDGVEATLPVFKLHDPGVTTAVYAFTGEVRCESLRGPGFLEMWSRFADGGAYFSRTLGGGPMAPLEGTSGWRPFVVPFTNRAGALPPVELSFGVHHPGSGRVFLRSVRLVQYAAGEDPLRVAGAWWSERDGGIIGGIAGSLLGLLGALVGGLAGACRARRLVFAGLRLMQAVGIVALVVGAVALASAQPFAVSYPMLLLGVIGAVLPTALLPRVRRRYEEFELRRMTALDAGT